MLSLHLIRSCFRCSTDAVNAIWPAVKFQWQHVSREDDDSTEMLCSLNCCWHFPPRSCLSHSNHIPWTITVVHDCSILPSLEWSNSSLNAFRSCILSFVYLCFFSLFSLYYFCLLFGVRAFVFPLCIFKSVFIVAQLFLYPFTSVLCIHAYTHKSHSLSHRSYASQLMIYRYVYTMMHMRFLH